MTRKEIVMVALLFVFAILGLWLIIFGLPTFEKEQERIDDSLPVGSMGP